MKGIYYAAKNSKKVNNVVKKNFQDMVINNFIEDKKNRKITKTELSWTISKENRTLKKSWK